MKIVVVSLLSGVLGSLVFADSPLHVDFEQNAGSQVAVGNGMMGKVESKGFGPLSIQGVRGQGIWFTGDAGEVVSVPDQPSTRAGEALTLRAWIWPARMGEHQGIVWKGDRSSSPGKVQYRLSLRPEGTVEFGCLGPRGDWAQVVSRGAVPCGHWTFVTATFERGAARIYFGVEKVAEGTLTAEDGSGGKAPVLTLPANSSPVEIGRLQQSGGRGQYPFCGGIDELEIQTQAEPPPANVLTAPEGNPLDSLRLFELKTDLPALAAKPVLTGMMSGAGSWFFQVADAANEQALGCVAGRTDAKGVFRYVVDDFCGKLDTGARERVICRAFRVREGDNLRAAEVRFAAAQDPVQIRVEPEVRKQVLGPVSIYANAPGKVAADPAVRRQLYGPVLADMKEVGVTHFDLAFTSLAVIEPKNDDGDAGHMEMEFFRANFQAQPEVRNLLQFLRYLRSEGFTFGIRSTGFAAWQVPPDPGTGAPQHQVEEIAETWVALLELMKEEDLVPTHLVPVWEPSYSPETVARICASTQRLARQHGFALPVIGPYVIATGGQSMNPLAMSDQYETGARYVRAYLNECGDQAPVIALEDYASGTPLIRPNLQRLRSEVIDPLAGSQPRQLWMVEYGAPCGLGPWNFYPSRWHGALSTWEGAFRLGLAMNQLLDGGVNRFFFWKAWDSLGETAMSTPSSWGLVKGLAHGEERRPPFSTARLFWRHLPEGSQVVGCHADAELPVNAVVRDQQIAVFILNPRSREVTADVSVAGTQLAPQARLLSTTEQVQYQEREIYGQGDDRFAVVLAPRSINTLLCRRGRSSVRFEQTRWPSPEESRGVVYLSDLPWIAASTSAGGMKPFGIDGRDVNWRRDETGTGDWLINRAIRYRKGLCVLGGGEIQFAVPPGADRFECRVGVDDGSPAEGPVEFALTLDQRAAIDRISLRKGEESRPLSIHLRGSRVLALQASSREQGQKVAAGWYEARFMLKSATDKPAGTSAPSPGQDRSGQNP